ncbi:MAG: crossover junction endodeoxyribonuclease RuvC [Acidobacteria bacterium]|nr:crossover junction endodeoxyribonuclease RuvC [Acidobacteriota bacterium]
MRVLGIDCGTECTGYGLIDTDGRDHSLVAQGTIRTRASQALEERLLAIGMGLRDVIRTHTPGCAAVEEVFHAANAQSALKLAHARGVALFTLAEAGLETGAYSPMEVKSSVVGYGRAEKSQVQLMVQSILRMESRIQSADAADALAVAICHATHLRLARVRTA